MNTKIKWIIFFLVLIFCVPLINKMLPSFSHVNIYDFNNISSQNILVAIEDQYDFEIFPLQKNNQIYLPIDLIKKYIDKNIFEDKSYDRITITNKDSVIRMQTDELNYYVNNKSMKLNLPAYKINSKTYLPANFLKSIYPIDINFDATNKIVTIDYKNKTHTTGKLKRNTNMRYLPDKKSPIAFKIGKNDSVTIYNTDNKYTKVRTQDGLIGYVPTKSLGQIQKTSAKQILAEKSNLKTDGKIKMVWEQILKVSDNSKAIAKPIPTTLNVLAPTWFSFDTNKLNGDIINLADTSYVENAHKNNCQVWALITDNFDSKICSKLLCDPSKREYIIRQLLAFVSIYNLDGINIDFEAISKDDAQYYLQFLRELYPLMKKQGAILSVDMFVPTSWTKFYNRKEIGKTVDYMCVMAYDEHTKNSETTGPVASYKFVANGIKDTLKEVPQEKIILGIPFYVRVWRESGDGFTLTNYSMDKAFEIFNAHDVKFKWLDFEKCFYGEYNTLENNEMVTYKTWLEDEHSIEEKLKLAQKYNLAGISGWKKNLEKDIIWYLVDKYIK